MYLSIYLKVMYFAECKFSLDFSKIKLEKLQFFFLSRRFQASRETDRHLQHDAVSEALNLISLLMLLKE